MTHGVPLPLTHNVKFNRVLHEPVLLVAAVEMTEAPRSADQDRAVVTMLSDRMPRVQLRFGFMEKPDVPNGLLVAVAHNSIAACNLRDVTYFTGHETIVPTLRQRGMSRWRNRCLR